MTCEALFGRMGFECIERSAGVFRVFTPLSFSDGEPISLYFIEDGNMVRVSDNADTLFHLRSIGLDVGDRKKWRGVDQIVTSFGMSLETNGEVTGLAKTSAAAGLVSRYLGAMLAVADLEREMIGITPEVSDYIDEVETHLRLWRPHDELCRNVHAIGHSGRQHLFHFKLGTDLIDAARPNSARTGSILRKSADIQNSASPLSVLIVMDDRVEVERARAETDILSTMVKVLPFSRLAGNLSGAPPTPTEH
jgi:hypothetical protein